MAVACRGYWYQVGRQMSRGGRHGGLLGGDGNRNSKQCLLLQGTQDLQLHPRLLHPRLKPCYSWSVLGNWWVVRLKRGLIHVLLLFLHLTGRPRRGCCMIKRLKYGDRDA